MWEKCGKLIYNTFGIKTWKTNTGGGIFCQLLGHWFPELNMH
jgi:hypothetical protein